MQIIKKILKALAFPFKHAKAWAITTSLTLAFFLVANLVITQIPLISNTFNTLFGEERRVLKAGDPSTAQYYTTDEGIDSKEDSLAYANSVNEEICEEGFVLLKNEDALPLANDAKVSVFGFNSVDLVYGGSGSAAKETSNGIDLYKSLENADIDYNPQLKNFYESKKSSGAGRPTSPGMGMIVYGFPTGELAPSAYSGGVDSYVGEYDDAALVVISRIGGEGYDLPRTMATDSSLSTPVEGAGSVNDHYLELDANEKALLAELCAENSKFDNIILVINCATSMELGFMNDPAYNGKIKGAVWVGTTGGTGMNALGKILKGEVNPSGRLVDTYAADFTKAPTWQNFGNNLKADGNRYYLNGTAQDAYFVDYEEGIYVGYRYYETMGYTEGEDWYEENVVFPFGYGLSYTDFSWEIKNVKLDGAEMTEGQVLTQADKDKTVSVEVEVTNNGDVPGKEVVQLYYSAPYVAGEVEKAHVVLGGFAKTEEIPANGGAKSVTIELPIRETASYDYADLNKNGKAVYECDGGQGVGSYTLYIGKNAHDAWANGALKLSYTLDSDFIYETDSATDNTVENRFSDVSAHIDTYLTRSAWNDTFPTTPTEDDMNVEQELIDSLTLEAYIGEGTKVDIDKPWYSARKPRQKRKQLSFDDTEYKLYMLIGKDYNDQLWDKLLNQLTYDEMRYLIGTGNFNTAMMANIDKPKTIEPDGPAGYTQFMSVLEATAVVYDTCFYASECVIGATWNVELAEKMGNAIGNESLIGNERGDGRTYSGWYAPAVNIHRSPFSGRNWEYYSEDGVLSGKMAAGVIRAAKAKGVYTYVKHFAVNDQETNRDSGGLITWLSEQSMREIYLKPFELAVKEGGTTAMMSSFNRIGTVWAGGSYELLTEVLRNEWGFVGTVISDYNTNDHMYTDQMIRAGGDLNLIQDKQPSASGDVVTASHQTAIRRAVKNILYTMVNSNAMNGMGEGIVYGYALPYWMITLIIFDCVLVAGFAVWGFFAIKKALKQTQ